MLYDEFNAIFGARFCFRLGCAEDDHFCDDDADTDDDDNGLGDVDADTDEVLKKTDQAPEAPLTSLSPSFPASAC